MKTNLKPEESVFLVITSSILIDGEPAPVGALVEMTQREAKPLLDRGKVRLATADDMPEGEPEQEPEGEPE